MRKNKYSCNTSICCACTLALEVPSTETWHGGGRSADCTTLRLLQLSRLFGVVTQPRGALYPHRLRVGVSDKQGCAPCLGGEANGAREVCVGARGSMKSN